MLKKVKGLYIIIVVFSIINVGYSQEVGVWTKKDNKKSSYKNIEAHIPLYELNIDALKTLLLKTGEKQKNNRYGKVMLNFPMSDEAFEVFEHSVLSDGLAAKYPNIKSYSAKSIKNPLNTIRFSVDVFGFHGVLYFENKNYYINPVDDHDKVYSITEKKDYKSRSFTCMFDESSIVEGLKEKSVSKKRTVDDGQLRTFRLALACTGEYAMFHISSAGLSGGTDAQKIAAVLSAMNTTMTRVNGVYERDLSMTMQLVPNNDEIIFLDPDTDSYTNNSASTVQDENQLIIDANIGTENYDIGHVFSRPSAIGGSGIGHLFSPCSDNVKARGVTGLSFPVGDLFDIDFVCHEMGHQFGATHTQNNNCQRSNNTAVEPGSGSSVMGYAGICPPNVQESSDDYFHAVSIEQIWQNITEGIGTCATTQSTGNSAPVVDGGNDYTIPRGTPFVLEAVGSDIDGDILTYSWEQTDNQVGEEMPPVSDATGGPIFRSLPPSNLPTRYFPNIEDLLNNNLSPTWEVIPTVARNLNFSVLVRDNNSLGGQTARDNIEIVVDGNSEPFAVTSHNSSTTLDSGEITTITWEVSNTNLPPINTSLVDIYLIVDDDFENLIMLDQNVNNDGTHNISIPSGITTSTARIMVKAVDNVFFAINSEYISIQESGFVLNFDSIEYAICQPDDLNFNFVYNTFVGFSEDVSIAPIDVPAGLNISLSDNIVNTDNTQVQVSITGTNVVSIGNYSFSIEAISTSFTKEYPISLTILSQTISSPTLVAPTNNSIDISLNQILSWSNDINAQQYELEISEQSNFSTIVDSYIGNVTGFSSSMLQSDTQYYWRVKSINDCNESVFSAPFIFRTAKISCNNDYVNNQVIPIDSTGSNTESTTINVTDAGLLQDIIVNVNISHTFISDLILNLTSPSGTTITLVSEACDSGENINATFNDEGVNLVCETTNPSISGIVLPIEQLSTFDGEQISGIWTLTVIDSYSGDGGAINSFGLEICAKDFYDINVTSELCNEFNDGSIVIETEDAENHTITISGAINVSDTFTSNISFTELSAGNYNVCIIRDGIPNSEQCFEIIIAEQGLFTVQSILNSDSTVDLVLDGAEIYTIELNGEISQVNQNSTTLQLINGFNSLVISTASNCHEPYLENFLIGNKTLVYPSPFRSEVTLFIAEANKLVNVSVHSVHGELIMNGDFQSDERGEIVLQLNRISPGIYIVNIKKDGGNSTHKIIKM